DAGGRFGVRHSERDVVVRAAHAGIAQAGGHAALISAPTSAARATPAGATAAAITAAEEDHIRGHDLGGVVLLPFLVGPLARLQASFDVALAPLGQVLTAELAELPPHHDAVPLGALLLLPLLVGPRLAGGDAEVGDRLPARGEADLRIRAEVAHQDDLVHSCHD